MTSETIVKLDVANKRVKYHLLVFSGIVFFVSIANDLLTAFMYALLIVLLAFYNYRRWQFGPFAEPQNNDIWREKNREISLWHYFLLAAMLVTLAVGSMVDLAIQHGADSLDKTIVKEFRAIQSSSATSIPAIKVRLPASSFKTSGDVRGLVGMYEVSSNTASLTPFQKFMRILIDRTLQFVPHFCLLAALLELFFLAALAIVDRVALKA